MPRSARLDVPGYPSHICIRSVDGMPCLVTDLDREVFLAFLREALEEHAEFHLHAFVLMTNHVHLLATPHAKGVMAAVMRSVALRYAQHFNQRHDRRGHLWQGRFWSSVIEAVARFYGTMRYVELNPVRAGMVRLPQDHRWSSYRHNAGMEQRKEITFHSQYLELGSTPAARAREWVRIVGEGIPEEELKLLRKRFTRNHPLGSADFERSLGFGDPPKGRILGSIPENRPEETSLGSVPRKRPEEASLLLEVARLDEGEA